MSTVNVKLTANVVGDDDHIKNIELGTTTISEEDVLNQEMLIEIAREQFGNKLKGIKKLNHITAEKISTEGGGSGFSTGEDFTDEASSGGKGKLFSLKNILMALLLIGLFFYFTNNDSSNNNQDAPKTTDEKVEDMKESSQEKLAKKLLNQGKSVEYVVKHTSLSEAEVKELK